jgi:hypothetical protein
MEVIEKKINKKKKNRCKTMKYEGIKQDIRDKVQCS